jgi:hypothetical protein
MKGARVRRLPRSGLRYWYYRNNVSLCNTNSARRRGRGFFVARAFQPIAEGKPCGLDLVAPSEDYMLGPRLNSP